MARKPKAELRLLTPAERRFAFEYAKGESVAKASEVAGISNQTGAKWLKDSNVQAFVQTLQREAQSEFSLSRAKIIHGLLKETTGPSHAGRVSAWVALAKIAGVYVEQHNHRGSVDVNHNVVVYIPDNGRGDRVDRPRLDGPAQAAS